VGLTLPDPEVPAQAKRRTFTAAYKARIVEEAQRCTESGAVSALLRREGLYSSHLAKWRRQCQEGVLDALSDNKRGRKSTKDPLAEENERLRKQNARLTQRLEQAETIIEIQKKVSSMLGIPLNNIENGEYE
jgi:transposase-like protein